MEKKKRRLLLLGSLVALLLLAFLVLSRVDVATDLIARKASAVVEEMTGLHLTLGNVRGNPVAGYRFRDLSLRKGEEEALLSAEKIGASVAFGSLLSGSPALDEIVVEGVRGDMGRLLSALPPSEGPSPLEAMLEQIRREGRLDVPLKRLGLKDVAVTTPAGDVAVASARMTFGGDAIASDLDFAFRGLPVKGDLKLVGVRPLSSHYFHLYDKELQGLRIKTKPGLLPPFYADMPVTLEEIQESERRYLEAYFKNPVRTDWQYFWKAVKNIVIKGKRSA